MCKNQHLSNKIAWLLKLESAKFYWNMEGCYTRAGVVDGLTKDMLDDIVAVLVLNELVSVLMQLL